MEFKRIFLIILDSLGVGEMPDADKFNDVGSNTLKSILNAKENVNIPNLYKLGFTNLSKIKKYHNPHPIGIYGKMKEVSNGKDTMTGHWEFMGLKTVHPFITFTENGFPDELIKELEEKTGHKFIGNKAASGTEIIKELGPRQMETGELIIYTSADSVLQIAAHEDVIPLEELYRCCEIAREITMKKEWLVGRVIARPYLGSGPEDFKRTSNRHDYALQPPEDTVLDELKNNGYDVISIGKIYDIFNGKGLTESNRTVSNENGMEKVIDMVEHRDFTGLCFVNLVDFDALYGHRRDALGYAQALESFDTQLKVVMDNLKDDDLLILSADHGNDPNFTGTDHTREYVPFVAYFKGMDIGQNLGTIDSFASIGRIIADNFNVKKPEIGQDIKIR